MDLQRKDLPKHVYDKKGVLYFQRRGVPAIRMMSAPGTDEFGREYEMICEGYARGVVRPMQPTAFSKRMSAIRDEVLLSAKKRAERKSRAFEIDADWFDRCLRDQDGVCALTGRTFHVGRLKRHSDIPSIDRIDSSLGYIPSNCRIVIYAANLAKMDMTDEEFRDLCIDVVARAARR